MVGGTPATDDHLYFLRIALAEAAKAIPKPGAFCVGCVLMLPSPDGERFAVLSTGFSRELTGNTHAEANALDKAAVLSSAELRDLCPWLDQDSTLESVMPSLAVYTTMEPCSTRTSGMAACADALIATGVRACYIGVAEPDDFVVCEGAQKLRAAGIEVQYVRGLEKECLEIARRAT
ncbi:cytidine deaminase-like protein [Pterulicium gracile]|uniref:Cytidine deaminase-like protein n=1 Tax=Pterulicium gracile TaxID=1884261 RepID=A0A5C3R1J9_9AGAR|nr:cytidine deaminase-like protein [Pterula gracilis]